MVWRCLLFAAVIVACGACALDEGPTPTLMPPLTVPPSPTLTFSGDCSNNRDLANWLQFTRYHLGEFQTLVSTTATQSTDEMYESVLLMGRMRDTVSMTAAPDCAEPAQRMALATINLATEGFQARVNGEQIDLTGLVAEVLAQFDQIDLIYADLNARLETQLQQAQTGSDSAN